MSCLFFYRDSHLFHRLSLLNTGAKNSGDGDFCGWLCFYNWRSHTFTKYLERIFMHRKTVLSFLNPSSQPDAFTNDHRMDLDLAPSFGDCQLPFGFIFSHYLKKKCFSDPLIDHDIEIYRHSRDSLGCLLFVCKTEPFLKHLSDFKGNMLQWKQIDRMEQ